jgi:anti-anti-sigma factor
MDAEISKSGEVTIVRLKGRLDFETPEPFRRNCLEKLVNEKVVFNLQELSFVGSCGITIFVELLSQFSQKNSFRPKFCGMNSEFRRLFLSTESAPVEIYDDQIKALHAFTAALANVDFAAEPVPLSSSGDWLESEDDEDVVGDDYPIASPGAEDPK